MLRIVYGAIVVAALAAPAHAFGPFLASAPAMSRMLPQIAGAGCGSASACELEQIIAHAVRADGTPYEQIDI